MMRRMKIRAALTAFLCLLMVPVLDEGETVLEVKYDKFLPAPVVAMLEGVPKRREAVSKYVKCLSILE